MVETQDFERLRSTLVAEAQAVGELPGSRLAALVRGVLGPDFQPLSAGATNFKDFVSRHVPELAVVGRAGMDVLYGVAHAGAVEDVGSPRALTGHTTEDPWRLWSNPNSQHGLRVTEDGTLEPVALDNVTSEHDIRPTTSMQHREIARHFLDHAGAQIPEEQLTLLREALEADEEVWFWRWMSATRMVHKVNRQWMAFRKSQLTNLLNDVVSKLPISPAAKQRAVATMLQNGPRRSAKPNAPRSRSDRMVRHTGLRSIVQSAVAQMSDDELRRVWLPVGVVMDTLDPPR